MKTKKDYMKKALSLAKKAFLQGDVPIGAVIVYDGTKPDSLMGKLCKDKGILRHGEILAIEKACKKLGDWRLEDCTLYVNLEPCPMCAGAILQARIPRLVFSLRNPKAGFCGSLLNVLQMKELNHRVMIQEKVLEGEARDLLSLFFTSLRESKEKTN